MEISYQGLFDTLKNKGIMQKTIQIIRGLCRRKLRIGLIKCHLVVMSISMQYRKAEYTKSLPFIVHISTRMEVDSMVKL